MPGWRFKQALCSLPVGLFSDSPDVSTAELQQTHTHAATRPRIPSCGQPIRAKIVKLHTVKADQAPASILALDSARIVCPWLSCAAGHVLQLSASLSEHLSKLARESTNTCPRSTDGAGRITHTLHSAALSK